MKRAAVFETLAKVCEIFQNFKLSLRNLNVEDLSNTKKTFSSHSYCIRNYLTFLSGNLGNSTKKGFPTPSLRDHHYRVQKLTQELLQMPVEEVGKFLLSIQEEKNIKHLIADATGFGFGQKYPLN